MNCPDLCPPKGSQSVRETSDWLLGNLFLAIKALNYRIWRDSTYCLKCYIPESDMKWGKCFVLKRRSSRTRMELLQGLGEILDGLGYLTDIQGNGVPNIYLDQPLLTIMVDTHKLVQGKVIPIKGFRPICRRISDLDYQKPHILRSYPWDS